MHNFKKQQQMRKQLLIGILILVLVNCRIYSMNLNLTQAVKFASIDKGKELLTTEDEFTKCWSQFDIDSRLQKTNANKEDLFKYISKQYREWTREEITKINLILNYVDKTISDRGYKITFPNEIYFIKTTTAEEGSAGGYTRANYVVLKEDIMSMPETELRQVIIHELFHILTRNNPEFKEKMYQVIGFKIINEISFPKSIKSFRITNPDAPKMDSYIKLKKDNKTVNCMMILYSKKDYCGGSFFDYLRVGFIKLKDDNNNEFEVVNNRPVIIKFNEVSNFFEQVGNNTQYIIHPEEILADNFAFAIENREGLPSQSIIDKIQSKLKE
jgi:hypothetical protein